MKCKIEGCENVASYKKLQICRKHYDRNLRYGRYHTVRRKSGTGSIDEMGYARLSKDGIRRRVHQLVVEAVLSKKLPKGAQVHHFDGDRSNNKNSNLVICQDDKYHKLLHARTRAYVATGDPSKRKCCFCKEYDILNNLQHIQNRYKHKPNLCPETNFGNRKDNTSGIRGVYKKGNRFAAKIFYKGRLVSLGQYGDLLNAACARFAGEQSSGYAQKYSKSPAERYVYNNIVMEK